MVDRFLALLGESAVSMTEPVLATDPNNQTSLVRRFNLKQDQSITVFCPGAEFGDSKKWPESHYVSLGRELVNDGDQVWLLGGAGDQASALTIAAGIGYGCINLTGKTTILDAIDLISLADRVVTNDSGLMHVAAAVGTRVIAIYGSTSPSFTPPLTDYAETVSLQLDCSPCFKRRCPLGHKDCLNKLSPDQVLSIL